ncbi:hypothetical protein CFter6_2639 [Collimonas fungivorans]|uniref:Uncharacterized protein n=1 Tax=Collimonas fungivorans TaxID=158899 RepID=A0A127PC47_9BURK|nr:hypothetical protein CFter6_2639 [Collimonas fungivorans]
MAIWPSCHFPRPYPQSTYMPFKYDNFSLSVKTIEIEE